MGVVQRLRVLLAYLNTHYVSCNLICISGILVSKSESLGEAMGENFFSESMWWVFTLYN